KRRGAAPLAPASPAPARAAAAASVAAPGHPPQAGPLPAVLQPAAVPPGGSGPREAPVPVSRGRQGIGQDMGKGKDTAAPTHCFGGGDMSAIVGLRKEWAPKLEAQGIKLTFMPFFIKAAVFALKEFPWVNGSVSPQGDAMVVKHYYNIGMAVGR